MGNQVVSELVQQAKEEHDGYCLFLEGSKVKSKAKELQSVLKRLPGDLPNLVEIGAKGMKLKGLPVNVFGAYPNLEVLSVGDNKIDKLPAEFKGANVVELYLTHNAFKEFPFAVLESMPSLAVLDMSGNQLTTVPDVKGTQFQSLRRLNLSENAFSEFPCEVCGMTNLESLVMSNNKLPDLPLDVGRLIRLEELIVNQNKFPELPVSLRQLKKLRVLDCSENELTELPEDLSYHKLLERLEAQHNRIPEIPKVVCAMEHLTHLKLHGNLLKRIPPEIGNLKNLSELNLKENEIEEIPKEIAQCASLRKLFLEYNKLRAIPPELAQLKKLLILILHHNQITTIPEELKDMRQLMRFSLNANPLDEETQQVLKEGGALALLKPLEIGDGNYSTGTIAGGGTYRRGAARRGSRAGETSDTPPVIVKPKAAPTFQKGDVNKEQLQQAFATLLDREDFSQTKKHMLNKLSDEEKWELMGQYAGSTLELMKNRPGVQKKKNKRPQRDFPKLIREGRANKNTFAQLTKLLKENADNYLTTFVNGGGIQAIVVWLRSILRKESLTIRDVAGVQECLSVLHTLTKLSVRSVITTTDCITTLCLCTSHQKIRTKAVEVLENVVEALPQIAPTMVLEAFQSFEGEFPYMALVTELQVADKDDKVVVLSLINCLIESVDELESRYNLRNEFNKFGVVSLLSMLKEEPLLQYQCDRYEEELRQDYDDMMSTHDSDRVLTMSQQVPNEEDEDPVPEGQVRIAVMVFTLGLHDQYVDVVSRTCTVSEVLASLGAKYSFKWREFGLYVCADPKSKGTQLKMDETLEQSGVSDADMKKLACRMTPWACGVTLPDGQQVASLFDPLATVRTAVLDFLKENPIESTGHNEYALFIPGRYPGTFRYLDEMKAICETSLKKKKYRADVFLRPRPITVSVKLSQDLIQTMVFDAEWQIAHILAEIASHVTEASVSLNVDEYHLVLVDQLSNAKEALDTERTLSSYKIDENSQLVLCKVGFEESDSATASETDVDEEDDVNIWDEPADCPDNITFEDGSKDLVKLESATLNKLVERVTSIQEFDPTFMSSFLSMFHSFCTPQRLWTKLLERYHAPPSVSADDRQKIHYRVCTFVKNWVEKETIEEPLKGQMEAFVNEELSNNENLKIFAAAITKSLGSPKGSDQVVISEKPPSPFGEILTGRQLPKNLGSDSVLTFFVLEEVEVARQLTLITYDIYRQIKPEEFFNQNWSKEKTKHLSPNLNNLVKLFNDVSCWVASTIVLERQVRNRAKLLAKYIAIAEHLRELNNFHLLMAFISAINTSALGRLKFTRARLPKRSAQALQRLEDSMSMQSAFKNYRRMLADSAPPCVPYIGVYLTDLTFMGDGNPDIIDRRINYSKHRLVYSVITIISTYQNIPYNFVEVWSIKEFLLAQPQLSESDIYKQSLIIEPRNAERGQIK